ncbi:MAG: hypothetical protein IKT62_04955 [Firmicutes bacterium]|nr:hypothetical protein [Bacillota bacterium]
MKKYIEPEFECIYFELDKKIMDDPIPGGGGDIVTNPWGDEFESGGARFNGLTLKA